MTESTLAKALKQFEAAEANLAKLERLWNKAEGLIPQGIAFVESLEYEECSRSIELILESTPKIDGWKPEIELLDLDAIAQNRLDAHELGEPEILISVERMVSEPGKQIREYRHRFARKRRSLVRNRVREIQKAVDNILERIGETTAEEDEHDKNMDSNEWGNLCAAISEIDRLLGSSVDRPDRWTDLRRHIAFAMLCDYRDIVKHDWPSVKEGLEKSLYDENEPIPVNIEDLGEIVGQGPEGPVPTALNWPILEDDDFERLIFALIASADGYENPEWLMKTNAPDKGRDLSVMRVTNDVLAGTTRRRVIIQCKHWQAKSVSISDVAKLKEQMKLWDSPPVQVVVIATTGRFSADAVEAIEKQNESDSTLNIEMWPESHLEKLLSARPALVAEFGLR